MLRNIVLLGILAMFLFLPFLARRIEENLEVCLFAMGSIAVTVGGQWSTQLIAEVLVEPIKITAAVLVVGLL
jgi:predicted cation transporter